jgi:hypothetical protein
VVLTNRGPIPQPPREIGYVQVLRRHRRLGLFHPATRLKHHRANPPATGKYDAVKKTLIDSYTDSREQQIRKLLNELELGDRKPSELLREMKTLAGDHVDDQMLQTLWLHRLPLNVQLLVSASDEVPLEKMANIADKLVEIVSNRGPPSIAAITNQPAAPPQTTVAESLKSLQEQGRCTIGGGEATYQRRQRTLPKNRAHRKRRPARKITVKKTLDNAQRWRLLLPSKIRRKRAKMPKAVQI